MDYRALESIGGPWGGPGGARATPPPNNLLASVWGGTGPPKFWSGLIIDEQLS